MTAAGWPRTVSVAGSKSARQTFDSGVKRSYAARTPSAAMLSFATIEAGNATGLGAPSTRPVRSSICTRQ